jgi:hypothetical protein
MTDNRLPEERPGLAGALPSVGGYGGHVGAPILKVQ